ncbi:hypothetical protein JJB11_09610 [Ramlibacter ginsenosidimutans]|uniref:DUF2059 domain-containing protein n=1 Tax=Ramlibacter ginsenosidimutans TaxID=502333 RepID=A0A934TST7_9BURK|nr:hypothetical protein [Ramlibacter ginsenosidimutans]MBK6006346.1 hypothetical protein [Ramlibacter ginsenosidimutans]
MAKLLAFVCALLVFSSCSIAQEMPRSVALEKISASWADVQLLADNSPLGEMMVAPYRSANPGVSTEEWAAIKKELLAAFSKTFTSPQGVLDILVRKTLEGFSDAEVARLATLLDDPVYKKYQAASASPAMQQQFVRAMAASALQVGSTANSIMARHGLREVH